MGKEGRGMTVRELSEVRRRDEALYRAILAWDAHRVVCNVWDSVLAGFESLGLFEFSPETEELFAWLGDRARRYEELGKALEREAGYS
jgi:hypothetical protein